CIYVRMFCKLKKNEMININEERRGFMIQSINHVTYSVSDINQSIIFYKDILKAEILVESDKTVYFTVDGLWLALNEEKDIHRNEIQYSYKHMDFTIDVRKIDERYQ